MKSLVSITHFCLAALAISSLQFAAGGDRPLTYTKFDPDAQQVEMFQGMEEGLIEVKLIPKDAQSGNIVFTNKQKNPVNVQIPEGFVAVPANAQFGQQGIGGTGGIGGIGGTGGSGGGGSQNQSMGGGMGGMGGGMMGGMGGGGMGMFSIPAEKSVVVPFTSVCLEHGKKDPHSRIPYDIVPMEKVTQDPVLQTLIKLVGTGKLDPQSAQAAAWHVANDMSWQELATKSQRHLGGYPDTPYFHPAQLMQAQRIVAAAVQIAEEEKEEQQDDAPRTSRTSRVSN